MILNLPQNTVSTLDIHEACLSPAKTRQHHAHPLQSKEVNAITKVLACFHQIAKNLAIKDTLRLKRDKEHSPPSPPGHPTILLS